MHGGNKMNMSAWIDVAIGLSVIFLGTSLFVTIINEYVAQILDLRGNALRTALVRLIDDEAMVMALSRSPALRPFFDDKAKSGTLPSYADPQLLARLLVGTLHAGSTDTNPLNRVTDSIAKMTDSSLKSQLLALTATAGSSMDELIKATSDWADKSLTVLGERYKRNLRTISFFIGLGVAVLFNIDTLFLTDHLYRNKESRDATVALALKVTEKTDKEVFDACLALPVDKRKEDPRCAELLRLVDHFKEQSESGSKLPIGWKDPAFRWTSLPGWVLTALALSLGAPFWFDLLNKVVNIRHGIANPRTKKEADKPDT